jgi:hypothetical protein
VESREKQLGLVDLGPVAPRPPRAMDEGEEFEGDEGGDERLPKEEPEES